MTLEIDFKKYPTPRLRHHTNPSLYMSLESHSVTPKFYPAIEETIDWGTIYKNPTPPDVLDVGCGRGGSLLKWAYSQPERNFLGVEVRHTVVEWINDIIRGESISNCYAKYYSAVNGFPFIEDKSLSQIVYLFPDPWVKKKHYKRRAFTEQLLKEFHRMLKPNGTLSLATDVPEVDAYQLEILNGTSYFTVREVDDTEWNVPFKTDQQLFSDRKSIPYVRRIATPL